MMVRQEARKEVGNLWLVVHRSKFDRRQKIEDILQRDESNLSQGHSSLKT